MLLISSRYLIPRTLDEPTCMELHHFSDESCKGYGQCSYLQIVSVTGAHCPILIRKSRVAPLKVVTIPKLELTAAVLSVKVSSFLKAEFNLPVHRDFLDLFPRCLLIHQ